MTQNNLITHQKQTYQITSSRWPTFRCKQILARNSTYKTTLWSVWAEVLRISLLIAVLSSSMVSRQSSRQPSLDSRQKRNLQSFNADAPERGIASGSSG